MYGLVLVADGFPNPKPCEVRPKGRAIACTRYASRDCEGAEIWRGQAGVPESKRDRLRRPSALTVAARHVRLPRSEG